VATAAAVADEAADTSEEDTKNTSFFHFLFSVTVSVCTIRISVQKTITLRDLADFAPSLSSV